jgi:hypothetical protein
VLAKKINRPNSKIPERKLSTGDVFQTIILRKGTVLFRGINFNSNSDHIVADFFGFARKVHNPGTAERDFSDKYTSSEFCVDPHTNVFFYPTPFVADVLDRYAVHGVFIVNYDLEIITMILPSNNVHDTPTASHVLCSTQSSIDLCGKRKSTEDPCLTELLIKEYPNIYGYIGIHKKDSARYTTFKKSVPKEYTDITTLFETSNEDKTHGIPEIVLFPYHVRPENPLEPIMQDVRIGRNRRVAHLIQYRSLFNYFPLIYITRSRIFTIPEIKDNLVLDELISANYNNDNSLVDNSIVDDTNSDNPILKQMYIFMKEFLSPRGITIHCSTYKCVFNSNTRLFSIQMPVRKKQSYRHKILTIKKINPHETEILQQPVMYDRSTYKNLHRLLKQPKHNHENFLRNLTMSQHSYTTLANPDPSISKKIFSLESTLPRPEFLSPRKRYYTRKVEKQYSPSTIITYA